jgi:hypothetical protein
MKLFDRLTNKQATESASDHPDAPEASAQSGDLPIAGYDKLDAKELREHLSPLSQVDLVVVRDYERSHQDRPAVLHRIHWLEENEPVSGYDALDAEAVVASLASADTGTLKAVREYERRHQARHDVLMAVESGLPGASASAGEERRDSERDARVAQGFANRAKG